MIFMSMASHLALLLNRGLSQLRDSLFANYIIYYLSVLQ